MRKSYILPVMMMLMGISFGQGLYYEGIKYLLELGKERFKQDQYLVEHGYQFQRVEEKDGLMVLYYRCKMNHNCTIEIIGDAKTEKLMIVETGESGYLQDEWNKQVKKLGFEYLSDYTIDGFYGVVFSKGGYKLTQEKKYEKYRMKIEKK